MWVPSLPSLLHALLALPPCLPFFLFSFPPPRLHPSSSFLMGGATQPAGLTSPTCYPGAGCSAVLELVVTVKTEQLPLQSPGGCVGAAVSEECKPVYYHIRDISNYVLYSFQLERKRKESIS